MMNIRIMSQGGSGAMCDYLASEIEADYLEAGSIELADKKLMSQWGGLSMSYSVKCMTSPPFKP